MRRSAGLGARLSARPERTRFPATVFELLPGPGHVTKLPRPRPSRSRPEIAYSVQAVGSLLG